MRSGTDSRTLANIYTYSHGHYTCKMHLFKLLLCALLELGVGWYITFLVVVWFDWIDLCSSQEAQRHRPQPQLPRQPLGGPQSPAVAGEPEAGGEGPQHWVSCLPWILGVGGGYSVVYFSGGVKRKLAHWLQICGSFGGVEEGVSTGSVVSLGLWWGGGALSRLFPLRSKMQSCALTADLRQFWWGGGRCQFWVSCLPWIICSCGVLSCLFPWRSEEQSCLRCWWKLLFHFVTKKTAFKKAWGLMVNSFKAQKNLPLGIVWWQHFYPGHLLCLIIIASFDALCQQHCTAVTHHLTWKTPHELRSKTWAERLWVPFFFCVCVSLKPQYD